MVLGDEDMNLKGSMTIHQIAFTFILSIAILAIVLVGIKKIDLVHMDRGLIAVEQINDERGIE